jgi:hypothetical protein
MLSTLLSFLPPSAWTWIASLYIIDAFHFSLLHIHSYHHTSYVFNGEVQCALRIPLIWLVVNPFDIRDWHAFLHPQVP